DYEDFITRLKLFPRLFEQTMDQMRKGMADGLMPPRMLLEKVVTQSSAIGTMAPEQSPFIHPFDKFPDSIPEADRKRLREAAIAAIRESLKPPARGARGRHSRVRQPGRCQIRLFRS